MKSLVNRLVMNWTLILSVLCAVTPIQNRSTVDDDSYIAAVVEYTVQSSVETNLQNYGDLIRDAAQQNADVVVFPEMTLTSSMRAVIVPINGSLKLYPVPADNPEMYDEILVGISAAAKQYGLYVVINIQEQLNCTSNNDNEICPEERNYFFNTNVVFDRNGAVIDRYRKINLFGEFTRTPAFNPDLGIFSTDFGVTFGHFICFDLMFQIPANQIVDKLKLTDIIFTTMWFSEKPYLTAVQIQEAYAYAMNVNFLASGANNVRVGSAGSGIYSGKAGSLVSVMPGVPTTKLLVSRVPKIPGQVNWEYPGPIYDNPKDHDQLVLISDPSLPAHVSRELTTGYQEFTLVDREVSCKFRVRLDTKEGETIPPYRAFVQDSSNLYAKRRVAVAACAIAACTLKGCVSRFDPENKSVIKELEIEMISYRKQYNTTLKCDNIKYFPSTLTTKKFPLNPRNYTFLESSTHDFENPSISTRGKEFITFSLRAPQEDLLTAGVFGRVFTKDMLVFDKPSRKDIENSIEFENNIFNT